MVRIVFSLDDLMACSSCVCHCFCSFQASQWFALVLGGPPALPDPSLQQPCARNKRRCHVMTPKLIPAAGMRPGFFLGDGAGVGKGRQIGGLIKEFWATGGRRVSLETPRDWRTLAVPGAASLCRELLTVQLLMSHSTGSSASGCECQRCDGVATRMHAVQCRGELVFGTRRAAAVSLKVILLWAAGPVGVGVQRPAHRCGPGPHGRGRGTRRHPRASEGAVETAQTLTSASAQKAALDRTVHG